MRADYLPKWMLLKHYRIKHKLLLTYPVLIVLSISVVSIFAISINMNVYKDKSIEFSQQLMKQVSHNIDNQLMRMDQDTYIFFQDQDIRRFFLSEVSPKDAEYYQLRIKIRGFLTNFLLSHPAIDSIYLMNAQGDYISTSDGLQLDRIPYYLEQAKRGDGRLVWLKTEKSYTGNLVIPAVRQINDLSTLHPNGTLLLNLRQNAVNQILQKDEVSLKGSIVILDGQGNIVSSSNEEEIGYKAEELLWTQVNQQSVGSFFLDQEDKRFYYDFYKSALSNWTYLYVISSEELFKGIDIIRDWMLGVAFFFTIIGVFASLVIARNISNPIHRIIREMKNIESNQLLVNLQYHGKDELSTLTNTFNHMMGKLREHIKKETDLVRMQHELEMRALQAEINPHFLYNTLEAINWMGRMNRVPEICEMTSKLADIMRYSIDSRRDMVTIAEERDHIKKYLDILQFRMKDRLHVLLEMPSEILASPIPKLTLQPIVENAMIHGLSNQLGQGVIRIVGQAHPHKIVIKIEDNGCGMDEDKRKQLLDFTGVADKKGIGLANVHKRLKLFFGEPYGLDVESVLGKGTRILISLPLVKEEKQVV